MGKETLKNIGFILLLVYTLSISGQHETRKWCFGGGGGLDFMSDPPTVFAAGSFTTFNSLNAQEGCSSISDEEGNLLFYTDGVTVWNKAHKVMANGTGLGGYFSASQAALIAKQPGSRDIYYIFTTPDQGNAGLSNGYKYSKIDLCLAAGMGSVTSKNILLSDSVSTNFAPSEKLTAVRHCNGYDTWIITHADTGNTFQVFLLSAAGISTTAVVSKVGAAYGANFGGMIGCLKASPNGKKLAAAYFGLYPFELFDFDPFTGIVSNALPLGIGLNVSGYGVEFSPDGSKLYGSAYVIKYIFQWDLCAASIHASLDTISNSKSSKNQLQLAPDGKIYMPWAWDPTLARINDPNLAGAACNYVDSALSIAPAVCYRGLPNFVCGFKPKPFTFTVSPGTCSTFSFTASQILSGVSGCSSTTSYYTGNVLWDFGDLSSGPSNNSTLSNPTHAFSQQGEFTVKLLLFTQCGADTIKRTISTLPVLTSGTQTSRCSIKAICYGESTVLSLSGASSYSWSSGASTPSILVSPLVTTTYSVAGTNSLGCSNTRNFTIPVLSCTGIGEAQSGLKPAVLFPNPAGTVLYIQTQESSSIRIYDLTGKPVLDLPLQDTSHELDVSGLAPGFYATRIITKTSVTTKWFIKAD